jgi:hypothetical protein
MPRGIIGSAEVYLHASFSDRRQNSVIPCHFSVIFKILHIESVNLNAFNL